MEIDAFGFVILLQIPMCMWVGGCMGGNGSGVDAVPLMHRR